MNQQPPLPPEIGETPPSRVQPDYIEIEVPVENNAPIARRNNGCAWGCGGVFGCLFVFVAFILGALALGAQTVADQFTGYFNLPSISINIGDPAPIDIPDDVYIPPVERVQSLSALTTTQYNYAEVTSGQRNMPAWLATLYGDSVVMVVVGTVEAGIDVSQITEEDIVYDELRQTLTVTLPAPVLQSCFLDESQSYVVRRETAVFADPLDNLEDALRQDALIYYRDTALEEGILIDAQVDATNSLSELLEVLVNDEAVTINILFEEPLADAPLPSSCQ